MVKGKKFSVSVIKESYLLKSVSAYLLFGYDIVNCYNSYLLLVAFRVNYNFFLLSNLLQIDEVC